MKKLELNIMETKIGGSIENCDNAVKALAFTFCGIGVIYWGEQFIKCVTGYEKKVVYY